MILPKCYKLKATLSVGHLGAVVNGPYPRIRSGVYLLQCTRAGVVQARRGEEMKEPSPCNDGTCKDSCSRKALLDALYATSAPELHLAASSGTCTNLESAALASFYASYSKMYGCRYIWGPSFLKPDKCRV